MSNNMNNMMYDNFYKVYNSDNNTNYIYNYVNKKLEKTHKQYLVENYTKYKEFLGEIQNFLFKKFFIQIYNNHVDNGNFNLEDILIAMNQITITQFEQIVIKHINQLKEDETQTTNQTTNQNINQNQTPIQNQNPIQNINQIQIPTQNTNQNSNPITITNINQSTKPVQNNLNEDLTLSNLERLMSTSKPILELNNTANSIEQNNKDSDKSKDSEKSINDYNTDILTKPLNTNLNKSIKNKFTDQINNNSTRELESSNVNNIDYYSTDSAKSSVTDSNFNKNTKYSKDKKILKNNKNIDNYKNKAILGKNISIQCNLIDLKKSDTQTKSELDEKYSKKYILFSSNDCEYNDGSYYFETNIKKISSINLLSFMIECNLYNIDENNNKFILFENDIPMNIYIPIGFYNYNDLIDIMGKEMTKMSMNKNEYVVCHEKYKNKTYIMSTNTNHILSMFKIKFIKNDLSIYSLQEILGFKNDEYKNNNKFVSENYPLTVYFDNIYFKILVNEKNIARITNNNNTFGYYDIINIDYANNFSKNFEYKNNQDIFEFKEPIDINIFSFEFYAINLRKILSFMEFKILLEIEYIE